MFEPREKWFRGSIFFSLKSLLVRRGESWLADRGQRRPCSGNPGKGISMVSWNSSSPNSSSFPEGQETRFEREEKRRKSLLRRERTWYSYTQTLFLGERCSSLHPPYATRDGLTPWLIVNQSKLLTKGSKGNDCYLFNQNSTNHPRATLLRNYTIKG